MAPASRPPSLPSIPDILLDLDEKTQLLPDLDEVLSAAGDPVDEEEADFRPARSHSTHTHHHRHVLLPSRYPSVCSSRSSVTHTATTTPHHQNQPPVLYVPPISSSHSQPNTNKTPHRTLPPSQKTALESWTITYHHPHPRTISHLRICGITVWRRFDREEGSVLSVVPNTHFSQGELAATVAAHEAALASAVYAREQSRKRGRLCKALPASSALAVGAGVGGLYAADLEARIRGLDWKVQDEIYELVSDRVQSSSSVFRRREWRVVVMSEIPGGELSDAPARGQAAVGDGASAPVVGGRRGWFGLGWKRVAGARTNWDEEMPVTEYRLILRGTETKASEQGWGSYNRYSRPWGVADDKEMGEKRRWSVLSGRSEKYVDF